MNLPGPNLALRISQITAIFPPWEKNKILTFLYWHTVFIITLTCKRLYYMYIVLYLWQKTNLLNSYNIYSYFYLFGGGLKKTGVFYRKCLLNGVFGDACIYSSTKTIHYECLISGKYNFVIRPVGIVYILL